jgi:3-hydroxy-9,10-secoandrosta-1,3,5(10)-triene-9,17-dione monooxygenase reductase component
VPDFDAETFRTVLRHFATGVAVITTWDGDRPWGTTVNSFSSVSLRPPLVLVAFDRGRRIVPALQRTGRYAVNILGEGSRALADCFAGGPAPSDGGPAPSDGGPAPSDGGPAPSDGANSSGDERSQLCGAEWRLGVTGLPVLVDAIAALECTVVDVHPAGDHDLYVARVDAAAAGNPAGNPASDPASDSAGHEPMPLIYYSGRYLRIERAIAHELEGKAER